jgi:hypothetical protein
MANDDVIDTIEWHWRKWGRTVPSGDRDMNSTRGTWIGFLLFGMSIAVAPFGMSARAQGFSPDPFQPYNNQFQQFVRPISPYAGGPGAAAGAMGRADNQYQQYLKELDGADRALTQRYGIGVQYWKLRSDVDLDKRALSNRRAGRQSEDAATTISQKYLAYFSEDDPRKRAILMRDFTSNRRQDARGGLARAGDENENGEAGLESGRPLRGAGRLSGVGGRSGASTSRDSAKSGEATRDRSTPPAPPPPRARFSTGTGRTQRRPSEVLDRSRGLDDDLPVRRKSAAPDRGNPDRPASPSPEN